MVLRENRLYRLEALFVLLLRERCAGNLDITRIVN